MEIGRRDAHVTAPVVHQRAHQARGGARRLVTAEEYLKIGIVRRGVDRGHDPRQLGQACGGDRPLHERDVLQRGRPAKVELVRLVYRERQRERHVVVQILPDP